MSPTTRQYLPNIINALSNAAEHQDNVSRIVARVEEEVKAGGHPTNNVELDVQRGLEVGVNLGLLGIGENDSYRLRFNPNAKPPLGYPLDSNTTFATKERAQTGAGYTGQMSDFNYDIDDRGSQNTLYSDEYDHSADEEDIEIGGKLGFLSDAVPRNELPFSICMQKFRMNQARRRKEAARRGAKNRSRSRVKRSKSRRRKR